MRAPAAAPALVTLALFTCSAAWSASCSSPARPTPQPPPGGGSGTGPGTAAAPAPDPAPPRPDGTVGAACKPDPANFQSTCDEGLLCFPAPGGYCTHPCGATGQPCPAGTVCMPSVKGGEMCARPCQSDDQCRADQGYLCEPGRDACSLPFMATPVLASCPATAPPAGAFTAPVALSSAAMPGVYQFEPSAVVTRDGSLVVVFTSGGTFFGSSYLGVARVPAKGAPVIDQPLATSKQQHFDAWAAIDKAGTIHAVWLGHDGGGVDKNAEIGYARSTDGGVTWTAPVAVHDPHDCPPDTPYCLDKPMIAVGRAPGKPGQEVVRVFYASANGDAIRMRTSFDGGVTWSRSVPAGAASYGDVAIDRRGRVHLVGSASSSQGVAAWGSTDNAVVYQVAADGEQFSEPLALDLPDEPTPFYFVNPSIEVDDKRGWIYVAYAGGTPDGAWDIHLLASKDGKKWSRRLANDDPTCANHAVPNLALDPRTGRVHLTWYENRGGAGHLAYTSCTAGARKCDPATTVSEPMSAYDLVRHSSKWLGEYAVLVADPAHRRLHAVWTQVGREGEHDIGRLGYASRKLGR